MFSKIEAITLDAEYRARMNDPLGTTTLELNLLEDPTAGLATGPAEELTPTELETRVRVLVSGYTPSLYRLLYTPFVDVVALLVKEGLAPTADAEILQSSSPNSSSSSGSVATTAGGVSTRTVSTSLRPVRPEEIMARWFTDGPATLKLPHATAEVMGKRRWNAFCRALEAHWSAFEDVMPLTRVVQRHNLREELYIPLFRQLAMELVDPTKRASAVATLPGIILSLANGRAPRSLGLPESDTERVRLVSNLFLGVAQETGNTDLAYLAVQLLRANDLPTPFSAQKQITNVFAAASRIETDWQMRATSLLIESYPKWLEYYKRVQLDNKVALEALQRGTVPTTSDESAGAGGGGVTAAASRAPRKVACALDKHHGKRSKGRTADSDKNGEAADSSLEDTGERSTEQYRYFTSRQQDDVTRVTALEQNIEAALCSRASELREVPVNRRRKKSKEEAAPAATSSLASEDSSTMPASPSEPPFTPSRSSRDANRAARSSEGVGGDVGVQSLSMEGGAHPKYEAASSSPKGVPASKTELPTDSANPTTLRRRGKPAAFKSKEASRDGGRGAAVTVVEIFDL
ncbi:conserved hypothetical protein [Leishmania mexicana MHOM/GT/2001/U1103]|uniref:Uncharacterized protein n=1 Tax=Leishmania mexicana (strain MHOM/GT/2001/U1103) TaxID=929439 RepID=E9AQJ8_LEIMU|nr:conserved hypothetical protein [Leishmania mexicana MHOM/GT/2001/U1103]CBZ25217.1 conserved hypothetical protein [Leishmania mexicana MHOM/GT/2001/U1103]